MNCKKTHSGKHLFFDEQYSGNHKMNKANTRFIFLYFPKCVACGFIDDRKSQIIERENH